MNRDNLNKARIAIELIIAFALVSYIWMEYLRPWVAVQLYGRDYRKLTYECDHAMHEEVATRSTTSNPKVAELLKISGDVALTVCHEYDKLRKRLLILGVSEDRLSLLGLEALEIEEIPVSRMVDPHRMDRF